MALAERLLNLFWIALGLALAAGGIGLRLWDANGPANGFLPFLAGLAVAAAGFALVATGRHRAGQTGAFFAGRDGAGRVGGVVAGLVVIALLMPHLGFALAAGIVMIGLLQVVERQNWLVAIGLSLISCGLVYVLFTRVLGSTLPRGPLGF